MKALTGNEHFYFDDMPTPHLLLDFWAWSSSDLLKGTLRGSLAEFIVATAIGEDITQMHEDRLPYDLEMPRGGETCKIEVLIVHQRRGEGGSVLHQLRYCSQPAG